MAPVARELSKSFRVLEPFQRRSGGKPLTVSQHVADLCDLVDSRCEGSRPALVGSSWGAMLALAFASAHPNSIGPMVLIGCGTFDLTARQCMEATLEERMDDDLRQRVHRLPAELPDPDERLRVLGNLLVPLYSFEPVSTDLEVERCDARGNYEAWDDMVKLQNEGVYPQAFSSIRAPVLMLHGARDPHPGPMIRRSLAPYIPQLEYRQWERCGHYPWLEKAVRGEFFAILQEWLARRLGELGEKK
jgi:pimeloyl-ACP methyl ester carboxylesterase